MFDDNKIIKNYNNNIRKYAAEYIEMLDDEKELNNLYIFNGLLKHIAVNVFNNSNIDINNVDHINIIANMWDIYCKIAYKYKHRPNILRFNIMLNSNISLQKIRKIYNDFNNNNIIDVDNINNNNSNNNSSNNDNISGVFNSNNGVLNNKDNKEVVNNSNGVLNSTVLSNKYNNSDVLINRDRVTSLYFKLAEKILSEVEAGLYEGATVENKVGCMFALKSQFNYVEASQPQQVVHTHQTLLTNKELNQLIGMQ